MTLKFSSGNFTLNDQHIDSNDVNKLKGSIPLRVFKLITGYKTKDKYRKGLRHHREIVCLNKAHCSWKAWKEYKQRCNNGIK